MSLWLVTPVHGRVERTRLCLEQRQRALLDLATLGIEAHQVIIGDDENLDTARGFGFHVLERPNQLGRKVNDGFEYACREGAAVVGYIGSDDWVLPQYLAVLPGADEVGTGTWQAFVSPSGDRLVVTHAMATGATPWLIPRERLEPLRFRPAEDERQSGIDGSMYRALQGLRPRDRVQFGVRERVPFRQVDVDLLQRPGFKGGDEQITAFERLVPKQRSRIVRDARGAEVWSLLAERYPADLVERMEAFCTR